MVVAISVIQCLKQIGYARRARLAEMMTRWPVRVAAIALAKKEEPRPGRTQTEAFALLKDSAGLNASYLIGS